MPPLPWLSVARLWDDCAHSARRQRQGLVLRLTRTPIRICVSRRERDGWVNLMSREYRPDGKVGQRNSLALSLFDQCRRRLRRPLLLLSAPYCRTADFLYKVHARNAVVAASIQPRMVCGMMHTQDWSFLSLSDWHDFGSSVGAMLTPIKVGELKGLLFVFDSEPIDLPRRGTKFLAYFGPSVCWSALARVAEFFQAVTARPIISQRPTQIRLKKLKTIPSQRPNMAVAVQQDNRLSPNDANVSSVPNRSKRRILFADIFAGAGGLSLGFLTARNAQYELCSAVDISPICITTLRKNLTDLEQRQELTGRANGDAFHLLDVTECRKTEDLAPFGLSGRRIDVLVGGPPCQPFSSARRRPPVHAEAALVNSFSKVVELAEPTIFLLENVQGILWPTSSGGSPAQKVMRRMKRAGYRVAARVLDAVWFGAPQHRSRAFIVGLHTRLGMDIRPEDAFPSPRYTGTLSRPYKTVWDAIGDLPEIPNGHLRHDIPACIDYAHSRARGTRARDDATRYARPDYIKELYSKRGGSIRYSYSGFEQLVHISSGVIRHFLDAAAEMYAEEYSRNQSVACLSPRIQDRVVREQADQLFFAEFDKIARDQAVTTPGYEQLQRLRMLVRGLGGAFFELLVSGASERRIFSVALSDSKNHEVLEVLELGVRYGYFHRSTIGTKKFSGRTPLYILTRRLAPFFLLDPTSFAGYQFITTTELREAMTDADAFIRQFAKRTKLGKEFEDRQGTLPL